jgi:CRP-like cAMP-binding protein
VRLMGQRSEARRSHNGDRGVPARELDHPRPSRGREAPPSDVAGRMSVLSQWGADVPPERNLLLSAMPTDALHLLGTCVDVVPIVQGQRLGNVGGPGGDVYLPRSGAVSLVAPLGTGRMIEVESIGSEGVVGLSTAFGGPAAFEAIGQLPGEAARMRAEVFRALLRQFRPMRRALLRYTDLVLAQAQRSAVCHASHRIEERCAKWLLVAHDRVGRDDLPITHEFLAMMLGVRRASVTVALGLLGRSGGIAHGRAMVRVVDRAPLEEASCECYRALRAGRERVVRAVQRRAVGADT